MSAGRAFFGFLHPIPLDCFHPETNRPPRIALGFRHRLFHRLIHFFQILSVLHMTDVPAQRCHRGKGGFHRVTVLRNPAGKFGVVVGDHQNERVDFIPARQSRDRRHRLFGLPLHAGPVGDHTKSHAVPLGQLVP